MSLLSGETLVVFEGICAQRPLVPSYETLGSRAAAVGRNVFSPLWVTHSLKRSVPVR